MLPIFELPTSKLIDENGQAVNISAFTGLIILVNFWSTECPYSQQTDKELFTLRNDFPDIVRIAVLSNQNEDPTIARAMFSARGYDHLWIDKDSAFAHACGARTTPYAFVFDKAGDLRYRGSIDDRTFRKRVSEVNYILNALNQISAGMAVDPADTPAYGCAIVDTRMDG